MGWRAEFDPRALKELAKLDRTAQKRIARFLEERITNRPNPRELGKALSGEKAGLWRYRVGDYRIICFLDDAPQIVRAMRVAHRKEAYR